ncbi:polysaccharide biosynthesis protein [Flavobacterium sp. XGLA_31]|uniref:polysaccharide biosynthesis protein n=1 Tax=Flavobacterium sp. XGLA_31 TaxID=3447666 RepID=UPI003F399C16
MNNNTPINFLKDLKGFWSKINIEFRLENLGYLPRWLVLLFDVLLLFMASLITLLFFRGLRLHYVKSDVFFDAMALYFSINVFFFWLYRTYSGIIRHSSYVDALKLFFAQFFSFTVLLAINYYFFLFHDRKLFLNTGLVINGFLSFSFLFLYRVIVKQTYERYFNTGDKTNLTKALIFGTDANAIALANALKTEIPKRFKLVGFIEKSNQNTTKRILDVPILHMKESVALLLKETKATALIIVDKNLSKSERSQIVEDCLEFDFKVYTIPLVADLEGQKEITKSIKTFEIQDLLERKPIVLDNKAISKQLKGKKVMVTGAAGSIGSEIVRQVLSFEPRKIIVLDQAESPLHELSLEIMNVNPNVKIVNVISDIRVKENIEQVFMKYKPEVVYHAAAYKHVPLMEENPAQAIFTNVMGTKNIADLAFEHDVERFVMVSTDKAVNPSNVMGASKRIAEKYVQSLDYKLKMKNENGISTKYITTRFGNVLGSNGSVVPLFTKQIQEGGPITITHPEIIRYFMTIPEACQLVLEAGAMGKGGEIFIFDMGAPVKIIDLARKMIRLAGFIPEKDIEIKIIGLRPGEKLYEELLNDTSKNLPTHNEKILIAHEGIVKYDEINELVLQLIDTAKQKSNNAIVAKMKKIVPEYKSLNSIYQELDGM